MNTFDIPNPATMHRGAKLFMDRGQASTYSDALGILGRFRVGVAVGGDVASSEASQVALLTAVNVARRAMLGGVNVAGCPDVASVTRLAPTMSLRRSVEMLGGRLVDAVDATAPVLLLGNVDPPEGCRTALRMTWQGWAGGVVPAGSNIRLAENGNMHLAAVLSASVAVGEVFQKLAGDSAYAGRRSAGLSIWEPSHPWTASSSWGPGISWLPSRLWLIGLGNLGQAYLWCIGALPFASPEDVRLLLQDNDNVQESNDSTSVLSHPGLDGQLKTRAMAAWAEAIGFTTRLDERRFGQWTKRSDFADDPMVAICGVDNAEARMVLEDARFPLVVEAGLGAGPQGYRDWAMHCFPAQRSARDIWTRVAVAPAAEDPSQLPAYQAARAAGLDPCGVFRLASRTVGVPFVGLTAATMAVGELLRRIHRGQPFDAVAATMSSLDDLECVPGQDRGPWLYGSTITR